MKPRCVRVCATIGVARSAAMTATKNTNPNVFRLRPANGLQREVLILERNVVGEPVERQTRTASSSQVGHFHLPRRPDALHVLDIGVIQPPDDLILHVVLEPGERVVVIANPYDRLRVLRRLRLLRPRLDPPARRPVDRTVAGDRVGELVDGAPPPTT